MGVAQVSHAHDAYDAFASIRCASDSLLLMSIMAMLQAGAGPTS